MARSRNTSQESTTTTKESKTMTNVLDAAQIEELLARQKSRGEYDAFLAEFLKGGEAGIEVPLTEGLFQGKKASNLKTGFDNARVRRNDAGDAVHAGGDKVKVIKVGNAEKGEDEHVYLINTALTGAAAE